ncbi:hypothetical protein DFH27DRAFT_584067 [Peziza echinospora]|nr:hypothetical protein DFH27DRAFT_584067 [Peziza echinospora]
MAMYRQLTHLCLPIPSLNTPRLAATRAIHALGFSACLRQPNVTGAVKLGFCLSPIVNKGFHKTTFLNTESYNNAKSTSGTEGKDESPTDIILFKDETYLPLNTTLSYTTLKHMYRCHGLNGNMVDPFKIFTVTLMGTSRDAILDHVTATSATSSAQQVIAVQDEKEKSTPSMFDPIKVDSEESWRGFLKLCLWKMASDGVAREQQVLGILVMGRQEYKYF